MSTATSVVPSMEIAELVAMTPTVVDILARWGDLIETVGEALGDDRTGDVALALNRQAGAVESRIRWIRPEGSRKARPEFGSDSPRGVFDVAQWRRLDHECRRLVAQSWMDSVVEEDQIFRVELVAEGCAVP